MKIDIHSHILPTEWPNLKEKYGYGGWIHLEHNHTGCARRMKDGQFFREVESNLWDSGVRTKECSVHGVDIQVLSTVPVMFSYWVPWLVGMPAETSRAICSMIFGGIFERLPQLRVAFAHGGGSFPATIGRIQHGFDVRPDLCAIDNKIDPIDYLGKFWTDSLVHDMDALAFLIKKLGVDKIALGTDYPFPLGELVPGGLIESGPLSKIEKEKMLYLNALDWLGITKEQFN